VISEEGYVDPLESLLRVLQRWLHLIAVVVISFVGIALMFSLVQTPMYEASIKMVVKQQDRGESVGLSGEVQGLQQLTLTMVELIDSRPVAEAVIRDLGLQTSPESFLANLSAEQVNATQVIEATYRDPQPQRAQRVINALGEEFSTRVSEETFVTDNITVAVWETAVLPAEPVSPDFKFNIGVALALGVMIGVGLAFLLEHLFNKPRPERYEGIGGDQ
jgi:capsular polysaccharide biosynthesis protein